MSGNLFDRYVEATGESVPLMMIPDYWTSEQIAQALEKCIAEKKPFNVADYDGTFNEKRKY